MIRAVIIGTAHMHVNEIALYISQQPDFELVGVADVPYSTECVESFRYTASWNLNNVKENYCRNVYENYIEMIEQVKPDIAFIMTENGQKPGVVEECAKRGINISIEKPIAINYDEAQKIKSSVDMYGITAVVNWPVMWRPYVHKLMAAIDKGLVGKPIKLQYINGHTGPLGKGAKHRGVDENAETMTDEQRARNWWYQKNRGGGVFLDIACYGCFFSEWLFGKGDEVISHGANLNTAYGNVDDNFAAIIKNKGNMSVIEGTWTTPRIVIPSGPQILCTEGILVCTGGAENNPQVKAFDIYGNEVEVPDAEFSDKYKNMPCHYANHITTGDPVHSMLTLEKNMEVMEMLDGVMRAAKSGTTEKI